MQQRETCQRNKTRQPILGMLHRHDPVHKRALDCRQKHSDEQRVESDVHKDLLYSGKGEIPTGPALARKAAKRSEWLTVTEFVEEPDRRMNGIGFGSNDRKMPCLYGIAVAFTPCIGHVALSAETLRWRIQLKHSKPQRRLSWTQNGTTYKPGKTSKRRRIRRRGNWSRS